jgi:hypothetical protein
LTATDSNGLSTSKIVNVLPRKSEVSLATEPAGLGLVVDGVPVSTPRTFTGVEGLQRELAAPDTAVAQDGTPLQFAGWSDGKSIRHVISTPEEDATYTAAYRPSEPFTAAYYDNTTFSGAPVLTRQDPSIDFAWGESSPEPALPRDGFAVRWTKTQHFGAGRYKFTAIADDGVRLYIDGKRVIDQWRGPANAEFSHIADLGEGTHTIKMEYVEYGGGALASLSWDSVLDQPSDTYRAEYWNMAPWVNAIPGTTPELARDEEAIDHDWGEGSPGADIGANRFAARWTRTVSVAPGDYEFSARADDGVRLYVDGERVIDKWIDQGPTTYRATLPLDGSPHKIVMEYYENGSGATAKLNYRRVGDPPAEAPWHGKYWNTPDATGPPSMPTGPADLERDDETLDFDWGEGSPGAGIAADRFVARWTKMVVLSAGVYRFSGARDDGMRVYVDDVPVVDKWTLGNEEYSVDKVLAGGPHEIRVDYFEGGSGARAKFSYDRVGEVGSAEGGWAAEYFANRNLTGSPVLTRSDDNIDFDWGGGSPGDGVPADNFSARWTKSLAVDEASSYKFTVTGDDGVRLYIDGEIVLDKWVQQGATTYTVLRHLTQGTHQVVLEYFDAGAGAVAKLRSEQTSEPPPPSPPAEPYAAEYFAGRDLAGTPVLTRTDNGIDFNWGGDGPGSGVTADNFSARWTRSVTLDEEGSYEFTVTGDDGVRLYLDGEKVLDKWIQQGATTYTVTRRLTQGAHQIVLEYFEANGDAVAKLRFEGTSDPPPPPAPEPFAAEYFDNSSLSGDPVLSRSDPAIDFDWGAGAPSFAVPFDRFSARWTRTKAYSAGTYRFTVTGDDGIRALVDGTQVVDGWFYQAPTTYTAEVPLSEGEHTVVVEYFEHTGGAAARFSELKVADPPP